MGVTVLYADNKWKVSLVRRQIVGLGRDAPGLLFLEIFLLKRRAWAAATAAASRAAAFFPALGDRPPDENSGGEGDDRQGDPRLPVGGHGNSNLVINRVR